MEKQCTVLIVDDNRLNVDFLSEELKDDYNLLTAGGGWEALKIMRENPDKVDLLLLDIIMNDISGFEVIEQMRSDPAVSLIPVIVISSADDPRTRSEVSELGAAEFLPRDADAGTIKKCVKNVLDKNEPMRLRREIKTLKKNYDNKIKELTKRLERERFLSSFMNNFPGGAAVIKTDGSTAVCTYFNDETLRLFGMNFKEFNDQFLEEYPPYWLGSLISHANKFDTFSNVFRVDGAGEKWIKVISNTLPEDDGIFEIYCMFLNGDPDEQCGQSGKETAAGSRDNEIQLSTLIDNTPGGISYIEISGNGIMRTLFISRGLSEMLGYPDYETCIREISANPRVGISEEDVDKLSELMQTALADNMRITYSFRRRTYDNRNIWLMMRGKFKYNDEGKLRLYSFIVNISKEKKIENDLRITAYYDPLTGLYNRTAFFKECNRILENDTQNQYSLLRINIGNFRMLNDLLGTDVGDKVLKETARAICTVVSDKGVYARFSADDFMVMMLYSERGIHPQTLLDAIHKAISNINQVKRKIQYYIGIYNITDRSLYVENMADRAAIALNSIKGSFIKHIAYYDEEMRLKLIEEQDICDECHHALDIGQFCVFYQPVYNTYAKKFVSAEALVRWNHPVKGMILPKKFVPVFEKNGFIADIDLFVTEQVCKYQWKRHEAGLPLFPISVNFSRTSLYDPNLYDSICEITDKYQVEPKYLYIEITESAYKDNPAHLPEVIEKFRNRGYHVMIDNYGSGYSSFDTLKNVPFDFLKLDMKCFQDFEKNNRAGTIAASVVRMAKWLGMPIVAEGVETVEQYEFLKSIDCAYIQGCCFAPPMPEDEFTKLFANNKLSESDFKINNLNFSDNINELLGGNQLISKLIGSVFGGFGIYEMNNDGKIETIRVNDGYMQMMGYSADDNDCTDIFGNVYPDDVEKCRNMFFDAANSGKAVRGIFRRYNAKGQLLTLEGIHTVIGGTQKNPVFCVALNDLTEKIKIDDIIENSREHIGEILSATCSSLIDINFNTGTFYHAGELSDYGFNLEDINEYSEQNNPFVNVVHPDDFKLAERFHKKCSKERQSEVFRIRNLRDGRYYWWKFTERRTFDDQMKTTRLIGIATNVDAEKKAQIAFGEERQRIDAAMDRLNAGILVLEIFDNNSVHIMFSNIGFWKVIGQQPVSDEDFIHQVNSGVDPKALNKLISEVKSNGVVSLEYPAVHDDGKNVWIEFICSKSELDKNDRRVYTIIVRDVTDRHESRSKLDAVVKNYDGGIALADITNKTPKITFANSAFYDILCVPSECEKRSASMIAAVIGSGSETSDLRIRRGDGSRRIVRVHIVKIGTREALVIVNDVTKKRSEAKNRIAERMANASCGLYDEVYEINYRNDTVKLISSRAFSDKIVNDKPVTVDDMLGEWIDKRIHFNDRNAARELFSAPMKNSDFTDAYCELAMLNPRVSGEYHTYGMVIVRSKADTCILFIRDKSRFDHSVISSQYAEMNRLYKQIAEQTHTTVIEVDHITGRVTHTPSLDIYWAAKLSEKELTSVDEYKNADLVYSDDLPMFKKFLSELNVSDAASASKAIVLRLKMADGSFKWCRLSISFTRGKNGKVLKSVTTINLVHEDVLARKKAEQFDELLRKTVRHIPVGVGIFRCEDNDIVPVYLSDNIYSMYGVKNGSIGSADLPLRELSAAASDSTKQEGEFSCECTRADGSLFWVNTQYRVIEENGNNILYAALSDISYKIAARMQNMVKEQMYRVLIEETGTIIFNYNPEKGTLSYFYSSDNKDRQPVIIEDAADDPAKLVFIAPNDRVRFALLLKKLSQEPGAEEAILKAGFFDVPARYKLFMKSVVDDRGKIFEIIGKLENTDEEAARLERIQAKAMYDPLCVDIYNKSTTEELVSFELERSSGGALLMIDVDDFKSINDNFGHVFGDEFLKEFASTIRGAFRDSDIVGRYGGDEFVVFMPHTAVTFAVKKANQILNTISKIHVPIPGGVKGSIGVAAVDNNNRQYKTLITQADTALYQAKNLGKNRVVKYEPNADTNEE